MVGFGRVGRSLRMVLLQRILPLIRSPHQSRCFFCFFVVTFVWTIISNVSFHQSHFVVNSRNNLNAIDDVSLLPPIVSTASSALWNNLLAYYDIGDALSMITTTSTRNIEASSKVAPYITDSLCSGCRHAIADPHNPDSERCGYYIDQQYRRHMRLYSTNDDEKNKDMIIRVIGDMIAQQFPKGCSKCQGNLPPRSSSNTSSNTYHDRNDEMCSKDQFQYWRYDSAAPMIRSSATKDQWFPSSKPKQHHFRTAAYNTTGTSTDMKTGSTRTGNEATPHYYYFGTNIQIIPNADEYFMEYNPSIVILPKYQYKALQIKSLLHDYYVISFRISNQNYCFHPKNRQQEAMLQHQGLNSSIVASISKDYLGIVIVNASSSNFPNEIRNNDILYDTIVDLKAINGFSNNAQDYRLFVLQKQLYISSVDAITPIWFTTSTSNAPPNHSRKDTILIPTVFSKDTDQPQFQLNAWVRRSVSCVNCHRKRAFCGKNFNYFVDDASTNNTSEAMVRVEVWPTGPHTVHSVDLNRRCKRGLDPNTKYIDSLSEVRPTFPTMEEVDFPSLGGMESIFTRGRGSACCIRVPYPSANSNISRTVLVGIQHTKTPSQRNKILPPNVTSNHYLSSFYAFESEPPYNIIAKTGWFCLGFPEDPNEDQRKDTSLLHRVTSWRKLVLGGRTYNCPRIHFLSGMTTKVNDPNAVILAYGINDCYSRFVEVRLSDIYNLLFHGPSV